MDFKVEKVIENKDGTATLVIDMGNEVVQMLIEHAVKDILTKYIEENDGPE